MDIISEVGCFSLMHPRSHTWHDHLRTALAKSCASVDVCLRAQSLARSLFVNWCVDSRGQRRGDVDGLCVWCHEDEDSEQYSEVKKQ